jgi:asparagine synthase (glutamine-hydrolysing)
MCGVIAANFTDGESVKRSLISLSSRGPDNQHYLTINGRFLGHTLLSLFSPDIKNSQQPIQDNGITVCANGEIYNYRELKTDLEGWGYQFKTTSDCEVIVHGLHKYGLELLNKIDGEFCFVSFNSITNLWICATDRFGTKPLKYSKINSKFIIGSTIESIVNIDDDLRGDLDIESIKFCLRNQVFQDNRTFLSRIMSIPSASVLTFNETTGYFNVSNYTKPTRESELVDLDRVDYLLERAIIKRLNPDNKISLSLSSGVDSSIIAIYLKKNNIDFSCYTVDFTGSQYSELSDVIKFSRRHALEVNMVPISPDDLKNNFVKGILNAESMAINSHVAAKFILNNKSKADGHKISFTGDGADEIFYGYSHFHTDDPYQFISNSEATSSKMSNLLDGVCFDSSHSIRNPYKTAKDIYQEYWLNNYGLKIIGDSQSASIGQEHRYPFLDYDLNDYLNTISNFKDNNYPSKTILRQIMARYDIVQSNIPKKPFTGHLIDFSWKKMYQEWVIENDKLHSTGLFNRNRIEKWIESPDSSIVTTQLLSLGILLRTYG